jgi:hypothetical protein
MQMRDELGNIYDDELFASVYEEVGQPAIAPWRLALISVLQFAENLSDRQAAEAVRARIDWKYALSLPLDESGFHYSGPEACKEAWKASCWIPSLISVGNEAISALVDGNEPIPRMCLEQ